jgi:nicotinic acetylcholine receptor
MPKWAETWICEYLATILLMKRANKAEMKLKKSLLLQETMYKNNNNYTNNNSGNNNFSNGITDFNGGRTEACVSDSLLKYELTNVDDTDVPSKRSSSLYLILKELQFITKKIKTDEEEEDKSNDWKFAAMVIDRLCLVFFSMATFISTAAILLTAKNFFKFR